jgi:hypothetical protein
MLVYECIDEGRRCWLSVLAKVGHSGSEDMLKRYRAFMLESGIPRYGDPGSHRWIEGGYFSHSAVEWLIKWLDKNGAKGVRSKGSSGFCGR